ncbi:MAG: hypothetical protein K0R72_688 [Clostridia bacterium]|jgi:hypothetical protein|nr:hypothetical protein [Clostridia bacterium]
MFQIIIGIIVFFILFLFVFKIKIEVTMEEELYIDAYIFKYIRIKRFRFNEDELKQIETKSQILAKDEVENYLKDVKFSDAKMFIMYIKQLLNKVRFEKIDFRLNINVNDYILNSYIVVIVNTVISMLISKNIEKINTDNLFYVVTSNEKKVKLNLKCIMYGKIADIMFVLIKIVRYAFKLKKRGNEKHGKGTSYRKSNGNSNDVARVNG